MSSILAGRLWLAVLVGLATTEAVAQKNPGSERASPGQSQRLAAPRHIQKLIDEGDSHQSNKDFQKAREKYLEAHEKTKELPDKPDRASLTIETALKVARAGANLPNDKDQLDATAKVLAAAGEHGTPNERARIDFFAADVALRQGQPKKAIEQLRALDWEQFDKSQQPILKYNLGRAYDLDGQDVEAFRRYGDALKLNPQFSQAAERATESAWKVIQKDPSRTQATSLQLSKLGLANRSAKFALTALSKPGTEDHNAALILLFHSWAATYPGPTEFLESDSFRAFAGRAGRNEQMEATEAVRELVRGGLELAKNNPWTIPPRLQWFERQDHDVRSACSEFAIAVGKWLIADARKEPQAYQGLARFMIAWGIDSENFNAAVESARVMTLDFPGINPELVELIVERVFERKEGLYYGRKGLHEWNQLETFHTFLGMIYEKREAWGSPDEVRSAFFQWQHAVTAHAEAQKLDPETSPAPGLHEHLAKAWLGRGNKDSAFDEYLLAAEDFLKQDDRDTATNLMKQADELNIRQSPDQKRLVDKLTRQLNAPP
jgi:tetratricopeptide (TPR) repeat protein